MRLGTSQSFVPARDEVNDASTPTSLHTSWGIRIRAGMMAGVVERGGEEAMEGEGVGKMGGEATDQRGAFLFGAVREEKKIESCPPGEAGGDSR